MEKAMERDMETREPQVAPRDCCRRHRYYQVVECTCPSCGSPD